MVQLPTDVSRFHGVDARVRAYSERQRTGGRRSGGRAAAMVLWLTLASACDGGDPEDAPPTFTELHERVLKPGCVFSTCHQAGSSAAGMMPLDRDVAHASLVDVPSSVVPSRIRVVPGDADASYVMEKITQPMPTLGEQMPPDAPLEQERVELVRAWIEAGAADD